jgi:TRAP transporter TAXI family solute receptor
MRLSHALACLAALALVILTTSCGRERRTIRIATGTRGGTFLPLGETLARSFERDVPEIEFVALESPGGLASIEMIERGEADLALLSNHVEGSSALRLVAPLYQETLQIVVRREVGIETLLDLRGRAISTGPVGSGTETIAQAVLGHFGLHPRGRARATPHDDGGARGPRGRPHRRGLHRRRHAHAGGRRAARAQRHAPALSR